jgi:hypothetical protein
VKRQKKLNDYYEFPTELNMSPYVINLSEKRYFFSYCSFICCCLEKKNLVEQRMEEEEAELKKEKEKLLKEGKITENLPEDSKNNKLSYVSPFDVFADYLSSTTSPTSPSQLLSSTSASKNPSNNSVNEIDGISKELLDKFSFLADDYNRRVEREKKKELLIDSVNDEDDNFYKYSLHSVLVHQGYAGGVFFCLQVQYFL